MNTTRTNAVIDTTTGTVAAGPFPAGKRAPANEACRDLNETTRSVLGNLPKRLRYVVRAVRS